MQQRGFTLIELIIVIVILGILAVTAAPRFIDLQSDANASVLQGVRGALQGGAQLVYAKSAIAGEQDSAGEEVTINGEAVTTDFGYPDASAASVAEVTAYAEISLQLSTDSNPTSDFILTLVSGTPDAYAITPNGTAYNATAGSACQVLYTETTSANASPTIVVQDGGC